MKNYVTFSMGICSAYIACRLQETCKEPILVFSDTGGEDSDTYRFGREVVEKWGLNIVDASAGVSLFDFFEKEKMIPARQLPVCSIQLKIRPSQRYFERADGGMVAYGYDMGEQDRADRTLDRWSFPHLKPWFPLIEWGVSKSECFGYFLDRGIKPPRMYKHFKHANCLPCKNFRLNDWKSCKLYYPDVFEKSVQFEIRTGLKFMQDGPFLKDVTLEGKIRKGDKGFLEPSFSFDMGCDACSRD